MEIKQYLKNQIKSKIKNLESELELTKNSLETIGKLNLELATYQVVIDSCWSNEGEKGIIHDFTGTLEEAINSARNEFLRINHRKNVDGYYSIKIKLGTKTYNLSREYILDNTTYFNEKKHVLKNKETTYINSKTIVF